MLNCQNNREWCRGLALLLADKKPEALAEFTTIAVDSVAIRRVDSLIQVSREFVNKRNYDKALETNTLAEKLALEKLGQQSAAYGNCCFNQGRILFLKRDNTGAEK